MTEDGETPLSPAPQASDTNQSTTSGFDFKLISLMLVAFAIAIVGYLLV